MTVTLLRLGETKDDRVRALCEDFERRLTGKWRVEHRVLRPVRLSDNPSEKEIAAALSREADEILAALSALPRATKIALCVEGKEYSSEQFAALIGEKMQEGSHFVFLIGSSYGLDSRVKAACDVRLSLSKMTMPHELCRLFFSESLYRAYTILHSMKYHK
ncbi:MAG: 23S rRNA (pseudouridine(1915)-N(3))-methyltransferase RlmH [Clostridia bacterium]|nr:23S rRNA (pseudouridine(1915)-N(3))-methyltransferase RlmH [Clostridia bacterium]